MSEQLRTALVTGGAHRLGRGVVEELCVHSWRVVFTYRSSGDQAESLVARLTSEGHAVEAVHADLDAPARRRSLVDDVCRRHGRLDALVNNAAIFPRTPLTELDEDIFRAVLRTNLEAPLFLALAAAPHLDRQHGAVVNIADIYAQFPLRAHLAYSVSKAGLIAATRALALELAPGVRVNAVAPGIALFPDDYADDARVRLLRRTPLSREGGPAEVARAVRFLLEGTEFVTGNVLTVDGGRTIAL